MDIKNLVPKHKFDDASIEVLKNLRYEEVEPIVPDLLVWLQDMNWPVAGDVREVLKPFAERIFPEFKKIFKSDDGMWKYWILSCFGHDISDPQFIDEMKRIARFPTEDEISEEVAISARQILNNRMIIW